MLDSMMASEEASSSSDESDSAAEELDDAEQSGRAAAAEPPAPPLLVLEADGDGETAGCSAALESQDLREADGAMSQEGEEGEESEAGHITLPIAAHTAEAQRRNVSFGANASFEAGATPPKVRPNIHPETQAQTHTRAHARGTRAHTHQPGLVSTICW